MFKALCLTVALLGASAPSHAFWGALGKLGSAAGKAGGAAAKTGAAGTAAKTGAAGGAVAVGAEAEIAAQAAAKAATTAAASGDDIARASGLGKAVPDEVAAMMQGIPAKRLADVPDLQAREWLAKPVQDLKPAQAKDIMASHDRVLANLVKQDPKLPSSSQHNWYLAELVFRAAHLGHLGAKASLTQRCRNDPAFAKHNPQRCASAAAKATPAAKEAKTKAPA